MQMIMKRFYSIILVLLTVISLFALGLKISNSRSFQFFGEIINQVDTQEKIVALTFDDGPTNKTDEILALLARLDIKATFYFTGRELKQNMDAGVKTAIAGHEIGNHSYSHKRMVFKSVSFIKEEIEKTDDLIRQTGYEGEIHFRPPNGKKLLILPYILNKLEKNTIMWNIEPDSYAQIASSPDMISDYVLENIEPGSIILLHIMYEDREESLNSIEGIVEKLRAEGYRFMTVSDLINSSER